MPRYAALIYGTEPTSESENDTAQWDKIMAEYFHFGEEGGAAGVIAGGEALQPIRTALQVQDQSRHRCSHVSGLSPRGPAAPPRPAPGER